MLRIRKSTVDWILAIAMARVLFAWPLHLAQHASEPILDGAAAVVGLGWDLADDAGVRDKEPQDKKQACAWCMVHAEQHALPGSPEALLQHAETRAPPSASPQGQPCRHCELAAPPRGPPRA